MIPASNESSGCLQTFMTIESLLSVVWQLPKSDCRKKTGKEQSKCMM